MRNSKTTKKALIMSVLSLIICLTMLMGTTYAWFTDSVSSVNNVIKSGNLDVELEYSLTGKDDSWKPVANDTAIFSDDDLWEPGHTQVAYLRVKNVGTLALAYEMSADIYLEKKGINVYNQPFSLSDHLMYGVVNQEDFDAVGSRELAVEKAVTKLSASSAVDLSGALEDLGLGAFIGAASSTRSLEPGESRDTAFVITMPTTVGNEANYKTGTAAPYIRFGINLYATQCTSESDSFDNKYDLAAGFEKFPIAQVTDNGPVEDLYVESLFGGGLFDENKGEHLRDMDATYTFVAPEDDSEYDDWIADYEVSVTTPNGEKLPEGAIVMAGQYNSNDDNWQAFYTPEVESGTAYRLLGSFNYYLTYAQIKSLVGTFNCGVENIIAPPGTEMTVALKLYKQDADNNVVAEQTVGMFTYTFEDSAE